MDTHVSVLKCKSWTMTDLFTFKTSQFICTASLISKNAKTNDSWNKNKSKIKKGTTAFHLQAAVD